MPNIIEHLQIPQIWHTPKQRQKYSQTRDNVYHSNTDCNYSFHGCNTKILNQSTNLVT